MPGCVANLAETVKRSIHERIFSKWPKSIDAKVVLHGSTAKAYCLVGQVCEQFFSVPWKLIGDLCDNLYTEKLKHVQHITVPLASPVF
jgi:hypothetical protein